MLNFLRGQEWWWYTIVFLWVCYGVVSFMYSLERGLFYLVGAVVGVAIGLVIRRFR